MLRASTALVTLKADAAPEAARCNPATDRVENWTPGTSGGRPLRGSGGVKPSAQQSGAPDTRQKNHSSGCIFATKYYIQAA